MGLVGLTVLMVPGLAACGGQGEVVQSGDVSVLVSERADGGMAAQGGGTLEVVGGCLGAGGSVIVWPHGTQVVQDQPLTILIPGVGTFTPWRRGARRRRLRAGSFVPKR